LEYDGEGVIYGRVAGVAQGSQWRTNVVDEGKSYLTIPETGEAFSYVLSSVHVGTLGTGQVQSAPMLARYPDTAYLAHGNYGVHYYLTLPLKNTSDRTQNIAIAFQTPVKHNQDVEQLEFLQPPDDRVFFRGTVRIQYPDERGIMRSRYFHLVQRRGQQSPPLVTIPVRPGATREVKVDFLYPPDATPPQVLTVRTLTDIEAAQYQE
ncbi:MAG: DUF3370 family protein, partial [Kamptonema sp. SIO4C4]|nr:DUF3370 family protein [Kamptonema sp. SIO4C4]